MPDNSIKSQNQQFLSDQVSNPKYQNIFGNPGAVKERIYTKFFAKFFHFILSLFSHSKQDQEQFQPFVEDFLEVLLQFANQHPFSKEVVNSPEIKELSKQLRKDTPDAPDAKEAMDNLIKLNVLDFNKKDDRKFALNYLAAYKENPTLVAGIFSKSELAGKMSDNKYRDGLLEIVKGCKKYDVQNMGQIMEMILYLDKYELYDFAKPKDRKAALEQIELHQKNPDLYNNVWTKLHDNKRLSNLFPQELLECIAATNSLVNPEVGVSVISDLSKILPNYKQVVLEFVKSGDMFQGAKQIEDVINKFKDKSKTYRQGVLDCMEGLKGLENRDIPIKELLFEFAKYGQFDNPKFCKDVIDCVKALDNIYGILDPSQKNSELLVQMGERTSKFGNSYSKKDFLVGLSALEKNSHEKIYEVLLNDAQERKIPADEQKQVVNESYNALKRAVEKDPTIALTMTDLEKSLRKDPEQISELQNIVLAFSKLYPKGTSLAQAFEHDMHNPNKNQVQLNAVLDPIREEKAHTQGKEFKKGNALKASDIANKTPAYIAALEKDPLFTAALKEKPDLLKAFERDKSTSEHRQR